MSETLRVPPTEITGLAGWLVKRFSRKMLGDAPESLGVMWHNRPVLMTLSRAGQKVQRWKQLDPQLRSFAHMAVATSRPTTPGWTWPRRARCPAGVTRRCSRPSSAT